MFSDDLLYILSHQQSALSIVDSFFSERWPRRSKLEKQSEQGRIVNVGTAIALCGFFGIPLALYIMTRFFGATNKRREVGLKGV